MTKPTVAVLGTGTMGAPIARNLLRAGFAVRAWNRTRGKAEALGRDGAEVVDTPAEAVRGAEFALTMLADADAVAETMEEDRALGAMERDAVWLQLSTVGVDGAERLAVLAKESGVPYVDALVLGTREPAEKGELLILASGPEDVRERCEHLFAAFARTSRWLGAAGTGSRMKMVVNMWLLAITEAAAESIALAEGLGVDPHEFLEIVSGGQMDTPYLHLKGEAILERSLEPSFKLSLAAKDAALVLAAAERARVEPRVARATHEAFTRAIELGYGDDDMAATYFATSNGATD